MKYYIDEMKKFYDKVLYGHPFSFVRFFDGEWYILDERFIDITTKCNGEWKFDPEDPGDQIHRDMLVDSLTYKDDSYYVGIMTACSCLDREEKQGGHSLMVYLADQDEEHLTFASLFMNYNYYYMVKPKLIPLLEHKQKVLVVNHKADISSIPNVAKDFRVGTNAWIDDIDIVDEIVEYAKDKEGIYFLVCAGPLSNIIIHKLHQINKKNTYINFGSSYDPVMFPEVTRWYHHNKHLRSHCCWWE